MQVSRHAQAHGLRHTLRKLWQTPIRRWHTFLRPQGRHNPLARQQPTPSHEERFAKVSDLIAKLPIESYISREGLQALSPHDLKVSSASQGSSFCILAYLSLALNWRSSVPALRTHGCLCCGVSIKQSRETECLSSLLAGPSEANGHGLQAW